MATYRESFVVRIACDPPALFWTGVGPLPLEADSVIPEAAIALGAGEIVNIPDFEQLINGTAERIECVLSGVSEEVARLALEDAPSVPGARVDLGLITFDADWQQDGPIEWEATFEARKLIVGRPVVTDGEATRSISLTMASGDTTRSRSPNSHFTDADQRRRSSTDAVFSNVASITAGTSRRFGPK